MTACLSPEIVQVENIVKPITKAIPPRIKFLTKFVVASFILWSSAKESMIYPERKAKIGKETPMHIEAIVPMTMRTLSVVETKRNISKKEMLSVYY